ncbi:hypothetical protein G3435_07705 [Pseudomonas sp. MAFF212428]|uniref:Uncharacterized protein n=1 Tax=Pseudomonas brassicae TaxID=2708063 RepID=A0A6B3NNT2_9PSED|nr:hypothetical protein [Pseudomonas brassicae]NER59890.1 hypothetical protein [Pseudomonas brassicae]NER63769.1 hypothetical protein [Pseudomonas brassicae]
MAITEDQITQNSFIAKITANGAPVCFSYFKLEQSLEAHRSDLGKIVMLPSGAYGITQIYTPALCVNSTEDMEVAFYFRYLENGQYRIISAAKAAYYKQSLVLNKTLSATTSAGEQFNVKFIDHKGSDNPRVTIALGRDSLKLFSRKVIENQWYANVGIDYTPYGIGQQTIYGEDATFRLEFVSRTATEPPPL